MATILINQSGSKYTMLPFTIDKSSNRHGYGNKEKDTTGNQQFIWEKRFLFSRTLNHYRLVI